MAGNNTANKRRPFQIERDRREIAERYLKGQTQFEIGQALSMTREMVAYDLKAIQRNWQQSAIVNLDAIKARELRKLDLLERTYWTAWENSLLIRETTSTKKKQKGEKEEIEAGIKKEQREGNPAFLAGVHSCIEKRAKLLGLDEPLKIDVFVTIQTWQQVVLNVLARYPQARREVAEALRAEKSLGNIGAVVAGLLPASTRQKVAEEEEDL